MRKRFLDFIGNYLVFPMASLVGIFIALCLKYYETYQLAQSNEEEDERDWAYFDTKETIGPKQLRTSLPSETKE